MNIKVLLIVVCMGRDGKKYRKTLVFMPIDGVWKRVRMQLMHKKDRKNLAWP